MSAPPDGPTSLGPATTRQRWQLGVALLAVTVVAVLLSAGGAPVAVRGPFVLLAGTLVPGYPLVVRLPIDVVSLLALDVCVSLAVEAAGAFLLVQTQYWHPQGFGLVLAVVSAGTTLVAVTHLRHELDRQ